MPDASAAAATTPGTSPASTALASTSSVAIVVIFYDKDPFAHSAALEASVGVARLIERELIREHVPERDASLDREPRTLGHEPDAERPRTVHRELLVDDV